MQPQPSPQLPVPSAGTSVLRTAVVIVLGVVIAALNTAIGYAMVGTRWVPIGTGVVLCLAFAVAIGLLHRATWLSMLSLVPALFLLVGSVQLAPELVLEQRGERYDVTILDHRAAGNAHTYMLGSEKVSVLQEPLRYAGSNPPYQVGDRLIVLIDPRGEVDLDVAADVNPAGNVGMLVLGVTGWTLVALLAGWRGHRRRHKLARRARPRAHGSLVGDVAAAFADGD